jgi:hypothetical protein
LTGIDVVAPIHLLLELSFPPLLLSVVRIGKNVHEHVENEMIIIAMS